MFDNIPVVRRYRLGKELENHLADLIEKKSGGQSDARGLLMILREDLSFADFLSFCDKAPCGKALYDMYSPFRSRAAFVQSILHPREPEGHGKSFG